MHTLRAFNPIRWELGFGSVHFIPRDALFAERTDITVSWKTEVPVSPRMNRSPIREMVRLG
jgi:hypothetical protein